MSAIVKEKILNFLQAKKIVKTKDIQENFNLSLSTTRRYLIQLEEEGFIQRTFGEIIYKNKENELIDSNANLKISENIDEKKKIAEIAAKFVNGSTPIFLDSGSSCFYLLDYLDKDLTIYTNSIHNANEAIKKGFKNLHILGGDIKVNTKAIVNLDLDFINKMYFPISFIGVNGISSDEKLTTPEKQEGSTKKLICENSDLIVVLCEDYKFNKKALYDFTPKNKQIVVVTNSKYKPEFANNFLYVTTNRSESKNDGYSKLFETESIRR